MIDLKKHIETHPDFPKPGILFYDISSLMADAKIWRETINQFSNLIKKYKITKVLFLGSALKFCYVAEGKAHIYPRSGTTYEWDTAAGHAIINGVGGKIETSKGIELKYGKKDFKNTNFIAKNF